MIMVILTRDAAASLRLEMYRVATTLSPSVTQKFMRLGCKGREGLEYIQHNQSSSKPTPVIPASSWNLLNVAIVASIASFRM